MDITNLRITQINNMSWIIEMPASTGGWINMSTDVYNTLEDAQRALQEAEDNVDYRNYHDEE